MKAMLSRPPRGATTAEMVVMLPTALLLLMLILQTALVYHARNQTNLAAVQAARAGSMRHAEVAAIREGLARGLVPLLGGGRSVADLARTYTEKAVPEAALAHIEILSPTRQAFDDYASPLERARLEAEGAKVDEPVIQNMSIAGLNCPWQSPSCNANTAANASGQTLQEANTLKLRIVWGLPKSRQVPLAGPLMVQALSSMHALGLVEQPAENLALLALGRIPLVSTATVKMQSEPIRNAAMVDSKRNAGLVRVATGVFEALPALPPPSGDAGGGFVGGGGGGAGAGGVGAGASPGGSTPAPWMPGGGTSDPCVGISHVPMRELP